MQEYHVSNRSKKRRRNENSILLGSIILCIVTMSAITVCLVAVFRYRAAQLENIEVMNTLEELKNENEQLYTPAEVDAIVEAKTQAAAEKEHNVLLTRLKEELLSGESVVSVLRELYPDEIVLVDTNEYYFFPILDTLKHHSYLPENFVYTEEGLVEYYEDGELISHMGIDVSRYQNEIDWKEVASEEKVEYAFIRLGIRGYTEGEIMEDERFEENIKGALDNDIAVGIYFFTQAISEEEAKEEAEYVLEMVESYRVDYPIVLDVEALSNQNARAGNLTKEERTKYCIIFCETIKEAGYHPMIYGNLKTFMLMLDLEQLEEYDKWFAFYNTELYFPYDLSVWQYSDGGSIPGIKGDVDLNISFEDWGNGRD